MQFAFGDHLLDVEQCELRRAGAPVAIEPQVFRLLLYLIENRDRVVSKSDLIAHVWQGHVVSDSAMMTRSARPVRPSATMARRNGSFAHSRAVASGSPPR